MKHIKRKFKNEKLLADNELTEFEKNHTLGSIKDARKVDVKSIKDLYLKAGENKVIKCFPMKLSGKQVFVPEPNPTLIYFDSAYLQYKKIDEYLNKANKLLTEDEFLSSEIKHALYNYYGFCSGCIIFLFTSLESFSNQMIEDSYEYKILTTKKTEVYNKEQIQRYASFDEKLYKILPDIKKKDFKKLYPLKYEHIKNLKEFRDDIVHTKMNSKDHTPYAYILKRAFSFKYEETMEAVRDFVNFYEPNLIEECKCGRDF